MTAVLLAGSLSIVVAVAPALAQSSTGPSSTETPYLEPVADGVEVTSILTVGNTPTNDPNYRMAGLPDGLGAFANRDGGRDHEDFQNGRGDGNRGNRTFTLLSNHEIPAGQGRVRDHGANGGFVSKWTIDSRTLEVLDGEDLIQWVRTNPTGAPVWNAAAKGVVLSRFCSADLPDQSALYNRKTGRGYSGRIFFSGEEVGAEGRAFGHVLDGTSWELPHLGNMGYENILLNAGTGDTTVAAVTDDTSPSGQVYIYVGTKQRTGNPIERAGLANGPLYGIKVAGMRFDPEATLPQTGIPFTLEEIPGAAQKTGAQIDTDSDTLGVTEFLRPEDGAWDPSNPRDLYFVTTDNFDSTKPGGSSVPGGASGYSRLWQARFDDINNPAAGGTITPLLDGHNDPTQMLDNMTVTDTGHVLMQEDPGNQSYNAKIWLYTIATDTLTLLAKHDVNRFGDFGVPPTQPPATQDEESSGIIPAFDILGEGWFLVDVQAHGPVRPAYAAFQPELVEDGQYLAMYVPQTDLKHGDDD